MISIVPLGDQKMGEKEITVFIKMVFIYCMPWNQPRGWEFFLRCSLFQGTGPKFVNTQELPLQIPPLEVHGGFWLIFCSFFPWTMNLQQNPHCNTAKRRQLCQEPLEIQGQWSSNYTYIPGVPGSHNGLAQEAIAHHKGTSVHFLTSTMCSCCALPSMRIPLNCL